MVELYEILIINKIKSFDCFLISGSYGVF